MILRAPINSKSACISCLTGPHWVWWNKGVIFFYHNLPYQVKPNLDTPNHGYLTFRSIAWRYPKFAFTLVVFPRLHLSHFINYEVNFSFRILVDRVMSQATCSNLRKQLWNLFAKLNKKWKRKNTWCSTCGATLVGASSEDLTKVRTFIFIQFSLWIIDEMAIKIKDSIIFFFIDLLWRNVRQWFSPVRVNWMYWGLGISALASKVYVWNTIEMTKPQTIARSLCSRDLFFIPVILKTSYKQLIFNNNSTTYSSGII